MQLCLIYNTAPHYREAIFSAIDAEYDCDWYFGNPRKGIIEMDLGKLKSVAKYDVVGNPSRCYWQKGVLSLLFKKKYQAFFMLGDVRSLTFWLFWLIAFLFFPKKRIYLWSHGWYGKEGGAEARMKLWLYRHCTGLFTYGEYARNLLIEQGIDGSKIWPIKNSLNYGAQLHLRKEMQASDVYQSHFGNSFPTLLFIGRLTAVKRLDMLLNAMKRLKDGGENYNLVFVGDGAERDSLSALVTSLGLQENVWFYGACYDERENANLIYNAEMCVSPGNIGLTAMHVLMFGTPAITHNDFKWQMPEFEAIKPGQTGDFFEKGSVESLAQKISEWFGRKRGKREEVREACFQEMDAYWNPSYQMKVVKENIRME